MRMEKPKMTDAERLAAIRSVLNNGKTAAAGVPVEDGSLIVFALVITNTLEAIEELVS